MCSIFYAILIKTSWLIEIISVSQFPQGSWRCDLRQYKHSTCWATAPVTTGSNRPPVYCVQVVPLRDCGFLVCGVGDGVAFTGVVERSKRTSVRTGGTVVVNIVATGTVMSGSCWAAMADRCHRHSHVTTQLCIVSCPATSNDILTTTSETHQLNNNLLFIHHIMNVPSHYVHMLLPALLTDDRTAWVESLVSTATCIFQLRFSNSKIMYTSSYLVHLAWYIIICQVATLLSEHTHTGLFKMAE